MRYFIIAKSKDRTEVNDSAIFDMEEILDGGAGDIEEDDKIFEITIGDEFKLETKKKLIKVK